MKTLKEDIFYLECNFETLLPFINSEAEKRRVLSFNKNIKSSFYPITQKALQDYYLNTNYSNLKKSFKSVNCAADVYSYFVQSYGMRVGSSSGNEYATGGQSSGLNPFFGINADLGFNFGSFGSWLWLILLAGGYFLIKDK
jgi:hypothetical protein